jgi:hypothetical protein
MANILLTCTNQRRQRQRFFLHEAGSETRYDITSPYIYDSSGVLIYTPRELDMRRKTEILRYQNSTNNVSRKSKFAYLSSVSNTTSRACPRTLVPTSTTACDVPGPPIMLYYDPTVPLYNYQNAQTITFQDIPYDDFKRLYDIFPIYNITNDNGSENTLTDIIILSPDSNNFTFGFTIPVSVTYKAYFNSAATPKINSAQMFIQSAKMDAYYSTSLVASQNARYNDIPRYSTDLYVSAVSMTIDVQTSVKGPVNVTQFVGTIYIPPIQLQTVTQYVYTFVITVNMGYSEYSTDPSGNAHRSNVNGGNITDASATSLTDVQYGTIINIEDVNLITTNSNLQNSNTNCIITLYQANIYDNSNVIVQSSDISYNAFAVTALPV